MLCLILFFILSCGFCNTQDLHSSCNETEDCTEATKCISQYINLEIYVMKNDTLVEMLAQTFFPTGRPASKFVKITYNFRTSNDKELVGDDITNCSSQQSTYIWSEAALYLLGPKAMYWLSLFAVSIHEVDVTIELPCLCSDVYDDLLSRLTYLVCLHYYNCVIIYIM